MQIFAITADQIERVMMSVYANESGLQFKKHIDMFAQGDWTGLTALGEGGLDLSVPERTACAARCAAFFGAGDAADALAEVETFADGALLLENLLRQKCETFAFSTLTPDGAAKLCTHRADEVYQDAQALRHIVTGRRRVVSFVAPHHIFGFLTSVILANFEGVEALDARFIAPAQLARELAFGDLVVATPTNWHYLRRSLGHVPDNVFGLSFGEAMTPDLATDLKDMGLSAIYEAYGATETGLIAVRDWPASPFQLLPHWEKGESDSALHRLRPDGAARDVESMDALNWTSDRGFRLLGRRDGAVQVGAVNVYPRRIGEIIEMHPLVEVCRVRVGRQREGFNRLIAHMALSPGASAGDSVMRDIDRWCRRHLQPAERPRLFTFEPSVEAMPKFEN